MRAAKIDAGLDQHRPESFATRRQSPMQRSPGYVERTRNVSRLQGCIWAALLDVIVDLVAHGALDWAWMRRSARLARSRSRPIALRVDRSAPPGAAEPARRTQATTGRHSSRGRAPTGSRDKCAAHKHGRIGHPSAHKLFRQLQIQVAPVQRKVAVERVAGIVEDEVAGPNRVRVTCVTCHEPFSTRTRKK